MKGDRWKRFRPAALLGLGVVMGVVIARLFFSPPAAAVKGPGDSGLAAAGAATPAAVGISLDAETKGMNAFLAAVKQGDFPTLQRLGRDLFPKGAAVREPEKLFAGFEANNIPPYRVFAFLSDQGMEKARRVMLTLDGEGRVESFMAEEMPVVK